MTIQVYLRERTRLNPSGDAVTTWILHWTGPGGKQCSKGLGKKSRLTKTQAKALRQRHEADINEGRAPVDKGPGLTLDGFRTCYLQHRRRGDAPKIRQALKTHIKLSDKTLACHDMVLRYLIEFFGGSHRLDAISKLDGVAWHDALSSGQLRGARNEKAVGRDRELSENSIRSTTRTVKAIFSWARSNDMIRVNPFLDFKGTGIQGKPNPHVPLEDFRKLCAVAPLPWRAMFALCRLAGLRREEALTLPWGGTRTDHEGAELEVGIDWDRKRLRVVGKGDRFREVPICPELHKILLDAFGQAPDGAVRVVHPITKNNLPREMEKFVKAARLDPWRKPYQSLRSSCENGWKAAGVPEPTYASWIGHGIEVSRKHYVSPQDSEFKIVTG